MFVGYAWESQNGLTFATSDLADEEGSDEVVRQAFANLEACESTFELVEAGDARVLVCAGQSAAEQILSERYMLTVHDALGADEVVVSIARRGSILACARQCPDGAKTTMINLHLEAWLAAPEDDRITNQLIVFSRGVKTDSMLVYGDGTVKTWD